MATQSSPINVPTGTKGEPVKFLKRGVFQRMLGKCATPEPADPKCWVALRDRVFIDLRRAPELAHPGGGIRLEGNQLPFRVLVFRSDTNQIRAYMNICSHGGRRLDPVPGTNTVQCCSVGRSTFDSDGNVIHGPAKLRLKKLEVEVANQTAVVLL